MHGGRQDEEAAGRFRREEETKGLNVYGDNFGAPGGWQAFWSSLRTVCIAYQAFLHFYNALFRYILVRAIDPLEHSFFSVFLDHLSK